MTLDGRVAVPGVALGDRGGEPPPRPRAAGRRRRGRGRDGDVAGRCAEARRARCPRARQPRRLVFGRGPLPEGLRARARDRPARRGARALGGEGVQSLLLEGGPTLATAFLRADLVDRLLLFVAPTLAGAGPRWLGARERPLALHDLRWSVWARTSSSQARLRAGARLSCVFTGIVRELGRVALLRGRPARDRARLGRRPIGDSVSVDGVCLTVVERATGTSPSTSSARLLSRGTVVRGAR